MPSSTKKSPFAITRVIHPVGQGAFYIETFSYKEDEKNQRELLSVVYDCGGQIGKIKAEIAIMKKPGLIFISHFHDDHIKGIDLLKDDKSDAIIVIPGISHRRFIVDLVYNFLNSGTVKSSSILFMLSCIPALRKGMTTRKLSLQGDLSSGISASGKTLVVAPGTKLSVDIVSPFHWYYDATYNYEDTAKEEKIIRLLSEKICSLRAILPDIDEYRDREWFEDKLLLELSALSKETREEIKRIYASVFDDMHNSYSMLVHSHSEDNIIENSDCLYTGDAEKSDANETYISILHPHYIQVPHHGSDKNHNPKYYHRRQIAFMSAGHDNKLHPGSTTVKELINTCPYIHIITEKSKPFKQTFQI